MEHLLVCRCKQVLVKSINGTTKIRAKIIVFRGNRAFAVCKGCNAELPVPIKLDRADLLSKSGSPRLVLDR